MFLGAADVLGRYLFNHPITGTYEISQILLASIVFFGLAYTQYEDKHTSIWLIFERFPIKMQRVITLCTHLLVLVIFILITWRATITAIEYLEVNRLLAGLLIPIFPFQLFVSLGASLISLELIIQIYYLVVAPDKILRRKSEEVQY